MKLAHATATPAATSGGLAAQAFSINANGKAFRALIDGIYSDKIGAGVRELMTNAYDGHLAAGNTDQPFDVHFPSEYSPEFVVRDYGSGMDHETIMGLYSTLFMSSKDESNEQVGMLGLGSKSPFAYIDSFTVTAFDGTTKRVYNAHISENVPQIALVVESSSDEPRGIEVKYPVHTYDTPKFAAAIRRCLLGFDVAPRLFKDAQEVPYDRPEMDVYEGTQHCLRLLVGTSNGEWGRPPGTVNIRQGCVVYPATLTGTKFQRLGDRVSHTYFIVDVPIGTSDVTTSREALGEDPVSRANVVAAIDEAFDLFEAETTKMYRAAVKTRDQVRIAEAIASVPRQWRAAFKMPVDARISLTWPMNPQQAKNAVESKVPGMYVMTAAKVKREAAVRTSFDYESRADYQFLIMDDETPRRGTRRTEWCASRSYSRNSYVIPAKGSDRVVSILKKAGFTKLTKIGETEDPGPGVSAYGERVGKRAKLAELDEKGAWVRAMRGTRYLTGGLDMHDIQGDIRTSLQERGVTLPAVEFTDAQIRDFKPDPKKELGYLAGEVIRELVTDEDLRHRLFLCRLGGYVEARTNYYSWRATDVVRRMIVAEDPSQEQYLTKGYNYSIVKLSDAESRMARFVPEEDEEWLEMACDALRRRYPLVFEGFDVNSYIESVAAQS